MSDIETARAQIGGTWYCDVCGEERLDADIDLEREDADIKGVLVSIRVKYCADRVSCREGAARKAAETTAALLG